VVSVLGARSVSKHPIKKIDFRKFADFFAFVPRQAELYISVYVGKISQLGKMKQFDDSEVFVYIAHSNAMETSLNH
jgi:hypothetical protein